MDPTQAVTAVIGAVGGLGGIAALIGAVFQRKRIRAETADVLTDTALTLVEPLQKRVRELDQEAREARKEVRTLRDELGDMIATLRRWKAAILDDRVDREHLVRMVQTDDPDKSVHQRQE